MDKQFCERIGLEYAQSYEQNVERKISGREGNYDIYCEDCDKFSVEPCWLHASRIENTPVVPLALASLPDCLIIDLCADSAEKGVFSKKNLSAQSVFGPMVGVLCSSTACSPFACRDKNGSGMKRFHLDSDSCSNWLRYVRFAKDKPEQNLMAYLHDGDVYFVTVKEIQTGEELKVGYSPSYEEILQPRPQPKQKVIPQSVDCEMAAIAAKTEEFVDLHSGAGMMEPPRRSGLKYKQTQLFVVKKKPVRSDSEAGSSGNGKKFPDFDSVIAGYGSSLPTNDGQQARPTEPVHLGKLLALITAAQTTFRTAKPAQPAKPKPAPPAQSSGNLIKPKTVDKSHPKNPTSFVRFPCTECSIHFPSAKSLDLHNLQHGDLANVGDLPKCPECGFFDRSQSFDRVMRHVSSHGTKYDKCPICTALVACKRMKSHKRDCQPGKSSQLEGDASTSQPKVDTSSSVIPDESGNPLEFPDFGLSLDDTAELAQYIGEDGMECRPVASGPVAEKEMVDTAVTREKLFPCGVCGKKMRSPRALSMHILLHRRPQCLLCAKMEESWLILGQHAQEHKQADGFHCPNCTLVFTSYSRLTQHYRRNHDISSFRTCEVCRKSFRDKSNYERHMLCHSDQFEYSCEICGKGIHRKDYLKKHMRVHHKKD